MAKRKYERPRVVGRIRDARKLGVVEKGEIRFFEGHKAPHGTDVPSTFYLTVGFSPRRAVLRSPSPMKEYGKLRDAVAERDKMERRELLDLVRGCKNCARLDRKTADEYKYRSDEEKERIREALMRRRRRY